MAVTYGFYDSVSGDRTYTALQFGSLFDGIIADGVFKNVGDAFAATPGTGMQILIGTGRGWFERSWIYNDAALGVSIDTAEVALDRIDTIVIETDSNPTNRENTIIVVKGTPAASPVPPTLINSGYVHQHAICDILVEAGVTEFDAGDITPRIGFDADTLYSTGVFEAASAAWLWATWETEFDTWFDNLVDQLTGVQVTNLQNQINAIMEYSPWLSYKNLLINGGLNVWQRTTTKTGISATGYYTADRWRLRMNDMGALTMSRQNAISDPGEGGEGLDRALKLLCTTAKSSPAADSILGLQYKFEGNALARIKKGSSVPEDLTLSFWVFGLSGQTYIAELWDTENNRTISRSFTISSSSTWEYKELTFPGDTSGVLTLDNANRFTLTIFLGAGSNYTSGTLQTSWGSRTDANRAVGVSNLMVATSYEVRFTGFQLEIGSNATQFEYVPYDRDLERCKRYFQVLADHDTGENLVVNGFFNTASIIRGIRFFDVEMRGTPTLSGTQGTNYYAEVQGGDNFDLIDHTGYSSKTGIDIRGSVNLSGTAGNATLVTTNASGARVVVDAELT